SKSPPLASQSSHSSHSQHTSPLHTSPLHPSPLHTSPLVPHHEQAQESHHAALHREFSSPINGAHGMHMSPPHGFASLPNPRQPYHNDRGSIVSSSEKSTRKFFIGSYNPKGNRPVFSLPHGSQSSPHVSSAHPSQHISPSLLPSSPSLLPSSPSSPSSPSQPSHLSSQPSHPPTHSTNMGKMQHIMHSGVDDLQSRTILTSGKGKKDILPKVVNKNHGHHILPPSSPTRSTPPIIRSSPSPVNPVSMGSSPSPLKQQFTHPRVAYTLPPEHTEGSPIPPSIYIQREVEGAYSPLSILVHESGHSASGLLLKACQTLSSIDEYVCSEKSSILGSEKEDDVSVGSPLYYCGR
ncbi:hypothetical protein ADUPG1_010814, partial [Aduncisulcus paluster]